MAGAGTAGGTMTRVWLSPPARVWGGIFTPLPSGGMRSSTMLDGLCFRSEIPPAMSPATSTSHPRRVRIARRALALVSSSSMSRTVLVCGDCGSRRGWLLGLVRGADGAVEEKCKSASGARRGIDGEVAADLAGESSRDRQAEPETSLAVPLMVAPLIELIEQSLAMLRRDSDAGVDHVYLKPIPRAFHFD